MPTEVQPIKHRGRREAQYSFGWCACKAQLYSRRCNQCWAEGGEDTSSYVGPVSLEVKILKSGECKKNEQGASGNKKETDGTQKKVRKTEDQSQWSKIHTKVAHRVGGERRGKSRDTELGTYIF